MEEAKATKDVPSSFLLLQACQALPRAFGDDDYSGRKQQDCVDFLERLLQRLDDEGSSNSKAHEIPISATISQLALKTEAKVRRRNSLVNSILLKMLQIVCDACKSIRVISSAGGARHLQIPIPAGHDRLSLQQCIDAYSEIETLDGFRCQTCGNSDSSSKSDGISEAGEFVFLNLNRVNLDGLTKNRAKVEFPTAPVTLGSKIDGDYEAIVVIKHIGAGLDSGHWTSCRKVGSRWWYLNDESVTKIEPNNHKKHNGASLVLLRKVRQRSD